MIYYHFLLKNVYVFETQRLMQEEKDRDREIPSCGLFAKDLTLPGLGEVDPEVRNSISITLG